MVRMVHLLEHALQLLSIPQCSFALRVFMPSSHPYDVAILGAGPSGLYLAQQLVQRGLRVVCISATLPIQWPNNYGLWEDDLPPDVTQWIAQRWERPGVRFKPNTPLRLLDRAYISLDNRAMIQGLLPGVELMQGWVGSVSESNDQFSVELRQAQRSEQTIHARMVVDTTGYNSKFTQYQDASSSAGFQTAYGIKLSKGQRPDVDLAEGMVLMDFSHPLPSKTPTFLYAMETPDGLFFEETVLVSRPACSSAWLKTKLRQRIGEVPESEINEREWCWIPMGSALPNLTQRTLAYGGAASMVHPATGYHIAQVLGWAGPFADAIAQSLQGAQPLEQRASACWDALWSADRQRQRALYCYGMDMLCQSTPQQVGAFFEEFFEQPEAAWRGYMSWSLSSRELATVMWRMFGSTSLTMKMHLMKPAAGGGFRNLVRAMGVSL